MGASFAKGVLTVLSFLRVKYCARVFDGSQVDHSSVEVGAKDDTRSCRVVEIFVCSHAPVCCHCNVYPFSNGLSHGSTLSALIVFPGDSNVSYYSVHQVCDQVVRLGAYSVLFCHSDGVPLRDVATVYVFDEWHRFVYANRV